MDRPAFDPNSRARILMVDDDVDLLNMCARSLRAEFDVVTNDNPAAALMQQQCSEPFAVVLSDMHMPGMTGLEFFSRLREKWPDTARIMLTADADQLTSIRAINEGQVAYFMIKPVPTDQLAKVLRFGAEQYRLRTAEKEILSSSINGTVNLLVQILSFVKPESFGRAARVRRLVEQLCRRMDLDDIWEIVVAALLSQLGTMTIPEGVLRRSQSGETLSTDEDEMCRSQPQVAAELVSQIPRLSRIADIVGRQSRPWDAHGASRESSYWEEIHLRAAFLKVAIDFDQLTQSGYGSVEALAEMASRVGEYRPDVFLALKDVVAEDHNRHVCCLSLAELQPGMVLDEPIRDNCDRILITRGQELAHWHLERLLRHNSLGGTIQQPIRVVNDHVQPAESDSRVEIPVPRIYDLSSVRSGSRTSLSFAGSA